jgi:hypothetical protein
MNRRNKEALGKTTYSVTAKLGHDGLHGLLILFEQYTQLFVLLLEGMVLDDNLGVGTLELRLEVFCRDKFSSREKLMTSRHGTHPWKCPH